MAKTSIKESISPSIKTDQSLVFASTFLSKLCLLSTLIRSQSQLMHSPLNFIPCHPGSRILAGLTWVSPNASFDQLDRNVQERWTGPRAEKPIVPFDSLQYPDWYAREKHWHPWVPHHQNGLWWRQLTHDHMFQSLDDEAGAKQDLSVMVKILQSIYRHIQPEGPRPDNAYSIQDLNLGIPHQRKHACRFMLSASGYIRWLQAHRPDDMKRCFREHLTSWDMEHILGWRLDLPGGVGVVLDLTRDQREMNIGLYLQHNIPVYYPWTFSAAIDSALHQLSPSYLLSSDYGHKTLTIPSPDVDFFFQPLLPSKRGLAVTAPKLPPLTHQILDFQGWIPRSISGKAAQNCFRLFYFEEDLMDKGSTQSYIRIYHRFRAHNPELKQLAMDICIRERWKFRHAPPPVAFMTWPPRN